LELVEQLSTTSLDSFLGRLTSYRMIVNALLAWQDARPIAGSVPRPPVDALRIIDHPATAAPETVDTDRGKVLSEWPVCRVV
jgi:hypothetical protein